MLKKFVAMAFAIASAGSIFVGQAIGAKALDDVLIGSHIPAPARFTEITATAGSLDGEACTARIRPGLRAS